MTQSFSGFGLPPKLLEALTRMRFESPTPIQNATIPMALEGHDILGSAQTGTGKTGAFAIPIIAKLMEMPNKTALIMTPTRELGSQVLATFKQMIQVPNLKTALLIGGEPMMKQLSQLKQKPRIIVGTPGRINDHLDRGTLRLDQVGFLVLDETDRMLDLGFDVQIETIINQIPDNRQTLMFSATIAPSIVRLSAQYLNNPKRISMGSTTQAAPNIQQEVIKTSSSQKHGHLLKQLEQNAGSTIIFVKTKRDTERLADKLKETGYLTDALHGDLKQNKRDRVIKSFRAKRFNVLVATDVAARGLDVPHIELVVNYDLPQVPEDYIHRIGRTARAGASGKAVNLLTSEDGGKWRAITRLMDPKSKPENFDDMFSKGQSKEKRRLSKDDWKQSWKSGKSAPSENKGKRRYHDSDESSSSRRPHFEKGPRQSRQHSNETPRSGDRYETSFEGWRSSQPRSRSERDEGFRSSRPTDRAPARHNKNADSGDRRDFGRFSRDSDSRKQTRTSEGQDGRGFGQFKRNGETGSFKEVKGFQSKRTTKPSGYPEPSHSRRGVTFAKERGAGRHSESWLDSIFDGDNRPAEALKSSSRSSEFSRSQRPAKAVGDKKKTKSPKKAKKRVNQLNFAA